MFFKTCHTTPLLRYLLTLSDQNRAKKREIFFKQEDTFHPETGFPPKAGAWETPLKGPSSLFLCLAPFTTVPRGLLSDPPAHTPAPSGHQALACCPLQKDSHPSQQGHVPSSAGLSWSLHPYTVRTQILAPPTSATIPGLWFPTVCPTSPSCMGQRQCLSLSLWYCSPWHVAGTWASSADLGDVCANEVKSRKQDTDVKYLQLY